MRLFWQLYCEPLVKVGEKEQAAVMKTLFVFSNGWFENFCRRHRISLRRTTRVVSLISCSLIGSKVYFCSTNDCTSVKVVKILDLTDPKAR